MSEMPAAKHDAQYPDIVIAAARKWLGTPYHHQASLRAVGCDCLGLIRGVWRDVLGHEPQATPAYTPDWAEAQGRETLLESARKHLVPVSKTDASPGDIVIFRLRKAYVAKHAGILSHNNMMIHALENTGVTEVPFTPWWHRHLAGVFRFPSTHSDRN